MGLDGVYCPAEPLFATCSVASASSLKITKGGLGLAWTWTGSGVAGDDFGVPYIDSDFWLCLYDQDVLVAEAVIPAGDLDLYGFPYWQVKRDDADRRDLRYKDKGAANDGVTYFSLWWDATSRAKLKFKGAGTGLPDLLLPRSDGTVVVQVGNSNENCWAATYVGPPAKNDGVTYSAKCKLASSACTGP